MGPCNELRGEGYTDDDYFDGRLASRTSATKFEQPLFQIKHK